MSESKLRTQSMDFSVSIINLVKELKVKKETTVFDKIFITISKNFSARNFEIIAVEN